MSIDTPARTTTTDAVVSPPSIVRLLIERAELLARRHRPTDARAMFAAAIAADPTPSAHIAFAVHLADAGDHESAIDAFEKAHDEARLSNRTDFRSLCCRNLAALYARHGDVIRQRQYQQLAIAAELESDDEGGGLLSADLLIDVAAVWSADADRADAAVLLSRVEQGVSKLPEGQRATIAAQRAMLAIQQEHVGEAMRHLLRAYRLHTAAGDDIAASHDLHNLGHLLQNRGRYPEARRCFRLAAQHFQNFGQADMAKSAIAFGREAAMRAALETNDPCWN